VTQLTRMALFLGMAGGLMAQTLSFGEITLVTPVTTPPSYVVDVILTPAGSSVAGLQFDLNYPAALTVHIAVGSHAAAISKEVSFTTLPAANNPSTLAAPNAGPGQRAIIIGVGLTDSTVSATGGPSTFNSTTPSVVATLTVQPASAPTAAGQQTLTLLNQVGTTAGALNTAAVTVPLTIGAGSSDPGKTGVLDLYPIYFVGGVYPGTSDTAPNFSTGSIKLNDLLNVLYTQTSLPVSGFPAPACGSDRFDAMDTFPQDTATTRGGARNGKISLNSLITELFMQTNFPGYLSRPVRVSAPYTCPVTGGGPAPTATSGARTNVRIAPEVMATLAFGANQGAGTGQDKVPVYLEATRSLNRAAFSFGAGDQQSQLQFQPTGGSPSILADSTTGIAGGMAVAWLQGTSLRAGERLLLGYIVGPAGSAANLRVFNASGTLLDSFQEFGVEVSNGR